MKKIMWIAVAMVISAGMLAAALWLIRYDIARAGIRQSGLARFIAASLLSGYAWLALAGAAGMRFGFSPAGDYYDLFLHSIFVGFVFSMIFGHAPVILGAVTGRTPKYSPWFYSHLALLHASLAVRAAGDFAFDPAWRSWGGLLNAAAIVLFFLNTAAAMLRSGEKAQR